MFMAMELYRRELWMGFAGGLFIFILILAHYPGFGFQDLSGGGSEEISWELNPYFWAPFSLQGVERVSNEGSDEQQLPPQQNNILYLLTGVYWLVVSLIGGRLLTEGISIWIPHDLKESLSRRTSKEEK